MVLEMEHNRCLLISKFNLQKLLGLLDYWLMVRSDMKSLKDSIFVVVIKNYDAQMRLTRCFVHKLNGLQDGLHFTHNTRITTELQLPVVVFCQEDCIFRNTPF